MFIRCQRFLRLRCFYFDRHWWFLQKLGSVRNFKVLILLNVFIFFEWRLFFHLPLNNIIRLLMRDLLRRTLLLLYLMVSYGFMIWLLILFNLMQNVWRWSMLILTEDNFVCLLDARRSLSTFTLTSDRILLRYHLRSLT